MICSFLLSIDVLNCLVILIKLIEHLYYFLRIFNCIFYFLLKYLLNSNFLNSKNKESKSNPKEKDINNESTIACILNIQ